MCKIYLFIWPSSVTDMELVACFWVFSSKISFVFSKIFLMESNFEKVIQGLVLGIKMGLFFFQEIIDKCLERIIDKT